MKRIIEFRDFIQPKTEYKILTPIKVVYLLLSKYPNKFTTYGSSSTNFNLRRGYSPGGSYINRAPTNVWCHNWFIIPPTELASIESKFNIKFNPTDISLPAGIECSTNKKIFTQLGIRFRSLGKHKSPLGISSFIVPWSELTNLRLEEM